MTMTATTETIDVTHAEDFGQRLIAAARRIKRVGLQHWLRDIEHDRCMIGLDEIDEAVVRFIEGKQ